MKKALALLLSVLLVFSSVAFAAPVLTVAENPAEAQTEPAAVLSETYVKGIKPGRNMITSTTDAWSFEGDMASDTAMFSFSSGTHEVAANPAPDDVNASEKVLHYYHSIASGTAYNHVIFHLPSNLDSARPVYVSFKYMKTYTPADGEEPNAHNVLWVMKNGGSYIAKNIGNINYTDPWKQYAGTVYFNRAYNAANSSQIDGSAISNIQIESSFPGNPGTTNLWYDDIAYVPYYKLAYDPNYDDLETTGDVYFSPFKADGTYASTFAESADYEAGLYDLTRAPAPRYGYVFKGWSLDPDATEADAPATDDFALEGEDIILYAVWEKDANAPEPTTYKWDFEDESTQVWNAVGKKISVDYNRGKMIVTTDSSVEDTQTPYLNLKSNVALNTIAHRYLVFKVKNQGNVAQIKFYFKLSDTNWSDANSVLIPIDTNSSEYKTYYYDMYNNANWIDADGSANTFINFMFAPMDINGGRTAFDGTMEFEEVYFSTLFDPSSLLLYQKWDFDDNTTQGLKAWSGHTSIDAADGKLLFTRSTASGSGGVDMFTTQSADVYKYLLLKVKPGSTSFSNFHIYFCVNGQGGLAETRSGNATATTYSGSDGYTYYLADFGGNAEYNGSLVRFTLTTGTPGTHLIDEIVLTNDWLAYLEDAASGDPEGVSEFGIDATSSTITEEGGSVTLTPYIILNSGDELEVDNTKVVWTTDSVNAKPTVNEDGSLTLVGKINGKVTAHAVYTYNGFTYSADKVITVAGQSKKMAANYFKYITFGNSIWSHGYAPSIGWNAQDGRGMAASALENDYVHRFIYYIEEKFGEGCVEHIYGGTLASYERAIPANDVNKDYSEFLNTYITKVRTEQPDLITIQMGENVSGGPNVATYTAAMSWFITRLQQAAPDALIIITTSFWGGADKIAGAIAAGEACGVPVAQMHQLTATSEEARKNEAIGLFEHSGVSMHPGDTGMDNMAKLFYEQFNRVLTANDPTEYTALPSEVVFTSEDDTITTENGTLQLSAVVLPQDSAQGVVWSVDDERIATVDTNGVVTAVNNGTVTVRASSRYDDTIYAEMTVTVSGQTLPYTLTYDPNTTDDVENMPETDGYAKDTYPLSTEKYPTRAKYNFVGWALSPDSEETVLSVEMDGDKTVYAVWTPAIRWDFERDGDLMGFTAANGFHFKTENGQLSALATETDLNNNIVLTFISPEIEIDPDTYKTLIVRMQNSVVNSSNNVKFIVTAEDGDHTYQIKCGAAALLTTYNVDLSDITGTITGFRIIPTNIDCAVQIEDIAFAGGLALTYDPNTSDNVTDMPVEGYTTDVDAAVPKRAGYTFLGWSLASNSKLLVGDTVDAAETPATLYAVWDKNDHWEFDNLSDYDLSNVESGSASVTDGVLTYVGKSDPIITPKASLGGYDVSSVSGVLKVRLKYNFTGTPFTQIFYRTSAANTLSEANSQSKGFNGSSDDWQIVELDLTKAKGSSTTAAAGWSGTLNYLRMDLTNSLGEAFIDYVAFTDSERNVAVKAGATRTLTADDNELSILVADGATVVPEGHAVVKAISLNGSVDMSNGYITVESVEDSEIGKNAPYAIYTLTELPLGNETFAIYGYDGDLDVVEGTHYVIPLDKNGAGYVRVGDDLYMVGKNGTVNVTNSYSVDDSGTLAAFGPVPFDAMFAKYVISAAYDADGRMLAVRCAEVADADFFLTMNIGDADCETVKTFYLDEALRPVRDVAVLNRLDDTALTEIDINIDSLFF